MSRDIKNYVYTCNKYHRIKPVKYKPYGALSSLPAPRGPFRDWTKDFITDMSSSEFHWVAYDSIFLVICRYTKPPRYIPARVDLLTERLAEAFLENVRRYEGIPDSLVSD